MDRTIVGFFERLQEQVHDPRLAKMQGSIRFHLQDGAETKQWLLSVDHGHMYISKRKRLPADTDVFADSELFKQALRGETHLTPAILRGEVRIQGNWRLPLMLERLFPSNPDTRGPNRRRRESS